MNKLNWNKEIPISRFSFRRAFISVKPSLMTVSVSGARVRVGVFHEDDSSSSVWLATLSFRGGCGALCGWTAAHVPYHRLMTSIRINSYRYTPIIRRHIRCAPRSFDLHRRRRCFFVLWYQRKTTHECGIIPRNPISRHSAIGSSTSTPIVVDFVPHVTYQKRCLWKLLRLTACRSTAYTSMIAIYWRPKLKVACDFCPKIFTIAWS